MKVTRINFSNTLPPQIVFKIRYEANTYFIIASLFKIKPTNAFVRSVSPELPNIPDGGERGCHRSCYWRPPMVRSRTATMGTTAAAGACIYAAHIYEGTKPVVAQIIGLFPGLS